MKLSASLLVLTTLTASTLARVIGGKPNQFIQPYKRDVLQDIVTWDEHTIFVNGERVLFLSGEFHPFRLPVPSLWLDVLQKIKALGFNGVSIYIDWALLEGKPGSFEAEGVFALEPFFEAAKAAGIYLIARPGPYINAEVSGGGFPGWLQRVPGRLRTRDKSFLNATENYVKSISEIVAKAQITNGGPVILLQPENEYTTADETVVPEFPDAVYFEYIQEQYRNAGIVVPFISNDARPAGYFTPGTPGGVDIYGYDGYPLGFDCANPYTWPDGNLPTDRNILHEQQSPTTPHSVLEFQGGSFDPWGGLGFDQCSELLNHEFERVFYKNNYGFGITLLNIYMIFGGTNWGNLGHPGGYTSYDYGSVIRETRVIDREKYSELKLEANFLQVSPAYWTAEPQNGTNGSYTDTDALHVTALLGNVTNFYVIRHSAYNSLDSTTYKFTVPTSAGNLTIPQLNGTLTLNGRDSKFHVTDYDVGGYNLLYSTAEIFSWKKYDSKTVLVVYGGPGEQHEAAFTGVDASLVEGSGVTIAKKGDATVLSWVVSTSRKIVKVGDDLYVYILDRNSAYNYWVTGDIILKAGYLIRNATVDADSLSIIGDVNATSTLEVIGGAPSSLATLNFNGESVGFNQSSLGVVSSSVSYSAPELDLPDLSSLTWKYFDTVPELSKTYSDEAWTSASLDVTYNSHRNLTTPTSLYSSDYGYHYGVLVYRGHFTATGDESTLFITAQGGSASGFTVWVNSTFVGSWVGADYANNGNVTFNLPSLTSGGNYVITVVLDTTGLDENWTVGEEEMKTPRGVLSYTLSGHSSQSDVTWKLTGNLGGEDYIDHSRGPLNEGGLAAERAGYHLPGAPTDSWDDVVGGPLTGLDKPGVAFYATTIDLDIPSGWDVPLSFVFGNSSSSTGANGTSAAYRAQLWVNGWQYGKYVHNVGPQDSFPVPEGIWDYQGSNYVAVSLWALEEAGAKLESFTLEAGTPVKTGYGPITVVEGETWSKREGAY
ncbi:putative beta-galactosidase [Phyllosticta paracitricarpa]|uniref:Beta-galactosidase n=1 Tax=Phyllosticta paracitricarpa TaxID=2016321 RepID=A0ABR1N9G5_9PEZI